ncbi:tyrosine-type recombinase/integrase, partial [Rhodopirellula bahusiensis]
MASLHQQKGNRPGFKIRWTDHSGKARVLWLGKRSKRSADEIFRHVSELIRADEARVAPAAATEVWANDLPGRLRDKLVEFGLASPPGKFAGTVAGAHLGPFLDAYIDGRTDIGDGTRTNYRQARRLLVECFGESHPIRSLTQADADRFRRWLLSRPVKVDKETGRVLKTMAPATVSKHIKRTKTMFSEAVRDRLLRESPFADQKGGSEANKDRHHFVAPTTAAAVLRACPDHDWRLIFALSRIGGMRCPSEVTNLRWNDVLWEQGKLRIDSPKTGLRFCPIFPELLPVLEEAFADAPEGATFCVRRYRADANLGTQMKRIIVAAGELPWEKLFINLRSTRRTELQEEYPSHVVDAWL